MWILGHVEDMCIWSICCKLSFFSIVFICELNLSLTLLNLLWNIGMLVKF